MTAKGAECIDVETVLCEDADGTILWGRVPGGDWAPLAWGAGLRDCAAGGEDEVNGDVAP